MYCALHVQLYIYMNCNHGYPLYQYILQHLRIINFQYPNLDQCTSQNSSEVYQIYKYGEVCKFTEEYHEVK